MSRSDHFLFYSTEISEQVLVLGVDEVAHLTQVLRFTEGDEILVTDGAGTIFECKIEKMKRDRALCSILSRKSVDCDSPSITVYVGVPDRDRIETLCEELPPLGVIKVIPVITQHCQKNWWDNRWDKCDERFGRKVIASIKQSHNPFAMTIDFPIPFAQAVESAEGTILFCDETGGTLNAVPREGKPSSVSIFVGPPGGFSDEEKAVLGTVGTKIALGPWRLRTELAAVTAVSLVNQWRIDE